MPTADPILEEIYAVREALGEKAGYDAAKIAESARKRQAESGRNAVTLSSRPAGPVKKAS